MTLEEVRKEWPVVRTAFLMAEELFQETNPGAAADLGIGPTFDELLDVSRRYLDSRVVTMEAGGAKSDPGTWGSTTGAGRRSMRWTPRSAAPARPGWRRCRSSATPSGSTRLTCAASSGPGSSRTASAATPTRSPATPTSRSASRTSSTARRMCVRYFKNERLGFSVTYYESNRPRQYYPDFIIAGARRGRSRGDVAGRDQGRDPTEHRAQERGGAPLVREDERHEVRPVAVPLRAAEEAGSRPGRRREVARRTRGSPRRASVGAAAHLGSRSTTSG